MRSGHAGFQAFVEWSLASALVALGVLSLPSIGVFVLPVALGLYAFVALRHRLGPDAGAGALVGGGATCLFISYRNRDYIPCTSEPLELASGQVYTCGGWDPLPWLVIGAVLAGTGLLGYIAFRVGWWKGKGAYGSDAA